MKRIIACLLTLVMLVALCPLPTVTHAAQLGEKPFYVLNHAGVDIDAPYVYGLPYFWSNAAKVANGEAHVSYNNIENIPEIAKAFKETCDALPEGARFFQFCLLHDGLKAHVEDLVYFDKGIELIKGWLNKFLAEYSRIGGKLDGIIVDLEYHWSHAYYIPSKAPNSNIYADIVADARYATRIRPMLEAYGFNFYENPSGEKSEIYCIKSGGSGHENCYDIWNAVMDSLEADAINQAVYEPLIQYYPNGIVSDYHSSDFDGWNKALDNFGNIRRYNVIKAGNCSNYNIYSCRPENSFYNGGTVSYKSVPSYNGAYYEATPFHMALYDANFLKDIYNSTDNGIMNIWISEYLYNIEDEDWDVYLDGVKSTYSNTPYYTEVAYHAGLLNPQPFLGFVVPSHVNKRGGEYDTCLEVLSDIMVELTRVAGASDRKPIRTQSSWNGNYILSGMYAAGRNIWRLTPDTTKVSLQNFKIADDTPTFSIDGLTITFPQGKILQDGKVREVGSCGYWIETPADVMPVITGTADRYRNNPSFLENFEAYAVGSAFTGSAAKPAGAWTVSGSAKVQSAGSSKALALTGDTTLTNTKIPQNITAGDEYAKQQAWEVTITLPEGGYGDVTLFSCGEGDSGIKISGGKVYYGDHQELGGVNLTAGTYTVKREVDFRTADKFTSTYAVYDASGNLLGEAKDVAMGTVNLPVTSITLSCTGTSKAVLMDDYKLYPTGVNAVFEQFDANSGGELTNAAGRTEDTAYRLSWLNATGEKQTAYIYNGSTLLETVEMAPGTDGVTTGVVKAEGKAINLSVKVETVTNADGNTDGSTDTPTDTPDVPTDPTGGNGDTPNAPSGTTDNADHNPKSNTGRIVAIVAAVVVIAGAVIALVLLKKKKRMKPEETSQPKTE